MRALKTYINDFDRFGFSFHKVYNRLFKGNSSLPKVLTISIPKSGTHMLQRSLLLHPQLYRDFRPTLGRRNVESWKTIENVASKMKKGRIISSHFDYEEGAKDVLKKFDIKAFFLYRDIRAIAVSDLYYILSKNEHPHNNYFKSLSSDKERLKIVITGNDEHKVRPLSHQFARFEGWMNSGAMTLKFEDLVGASGGGCDDIQVQKLRQIYDHLELDVDTSFIKDIQSELFSGKTPTFRSGKIDSWRSLFDDEITELFKKHCGELLIKLNYEKDQSW